ncbi:hypothetical protein [Actomonas aquatica]|uniref:Anti sigma-E protein RseA N-terminal domain-containing protein n=1 Tax=Actomonas aquatica TaxID=2866162 RepID=A0ABZ1CD37_9BACT|nr:hypothetical protein [Opitutus sp. WL0086]WRQ88215.1 hypothetical protein K1X11_002275 [Opitutus sp. WL0086]
MNDERFIELLNLYIDRELAGPEIQEIEEAIAADPQRQRIYAQYCKIERACEHLLVSEARTAPKPKIDAIIAAAQQPEEEAEVLDFPAEAPRAPQTEVVVRRQSRSSWGWGALSGMAAAVAAFAVYTGTVQTAQNDGVSPVEAAAPSMASAPATAPVGIDDSAAPAFAANDNSDYRTVLVLSRDENNARPGLRIADSANRDDPFAWMSQVTFEPIRPVQADSLEFRTAAPMEVRNLPAFASPYPGLDDTPPLSESAAFQFQR